MISIVLPAYNVEKELRVLFTSLRKSTYQDLEICICDDNSTDNTVQVIKEFSKTFNISYTVNQVNKGVTYTRNAAVKLARNDLLLFLDADIRLYTDTIERLMATMRSSGAPVVQAIYSEVALDKSIFSEYYALFINHSFLQLPGEWIEDNVFNGWCCLCRKEVITDTQGHNIVTKGVEIENETMGRKILAKGHKIVLAKNIMVDHHWGGYKKLVFIFTKRVYWWVKIFFATGFAFEKALTNKNYGLSTIAIPGAGLSTVLAVTVEPWFWLPAVLFFSCYVLGYLGFYTFVFRKKGPLFFIFSILVSIYFSFFITVSAGYSFAEEISRMIIRRHGTLDPAGLAPSV